MIEILKFASIGALFSTIIVSIILIVIRIFVLYMDDRISSVTLMLFFLPSTFIMFMSISVFIEIERKSHPKEPLPVHNQNYESNR